MPDKDKAQVVKHGDVTQRVGVEVIRALGVNVDKLIKTLIANAGAEFQDTYYYYTILRMYLAGHEDYKEICEDARLEDRAHSELICRASTSWAANCRRIMPRVHRPGRLSRRLPAGASRRRRTS